MPIIVTPAQTGTESLILDGLELNDSTTFGLTEFVCSPPRQRQEWSGAADSEAQLLMRNPLHENRTITARLIVPVQASTDGVLDKIAQVVDKLAKASKDSDGIELIWTPGDSARTATFDVLAGEIVDMPISWESGWMSKSPQFTIEMTAKPYWRGTETLTSVATFSTPLGTLEIPTVTGDAPALGRLIATDTATQARRHVEWGLEGPNTYGPSTVLLLDSDSLVTSGFAGTQAAAGGYDPGASGSNIVVLSNAPEQSVAMFGIGAQPHIGSFLVRARVQKVTGGTSGLPSLRFVWRAGDGPMSENAWVQPVAEGRWEDIELGQVTIPAAIAGTQTWTGQLEVGGLQGITLYVDYLLLIPVSDGYGRARATYTGRASNTVAAYDHFGGTPGNVLNGRTPQVGTGNWATSGDTFDFGFDQVGSESVSRATVSDATGGRYALLGTGTFTDVEVTVQLVKVAGAPTSGGNILRGLVARWTDASNHLRLHAATSGTSPEYLALTLEQVIAGTATTIAQVPIALNWGSSYQLRLVVFSSGHAIGMILDAAGSAILASVEAVATVLATGGTLQTGQAGMRDKSTSTGVVTRVYRSPSIATPAAEPFVIYSGRNMQVRHDDVIRQDSTGIYMGRPQSYRGSRFLVPVGTSRIAVKARRNDIETAADDNVTDATQIQVGWTQRGLAVPR